MDHITHEKDATSSAMEIEPAQSNKRPRESEIGLHRLENLNTCEPSTKRFKAYHITQTNSPTLEVEFKNKLIAICENYRKNKDLVEVEQGLKSCFDLTNNSPHLLNVSINLGRSQGRTLLWMTAYWRLWDLVATMLASCPNPNIDAAIAEGLGKGISVLWIAAFDKQWGLVAKMLESQTNANIDAAPAERPSKGISVLWIAACDKQWGLVAKMLESQPNANIDAAPAEGPNKGKSMLWMAAYWKQWSLVATMLANQPKANINATSVAGQTVLDFVLQDLAHPKANEVAYCCILLGAGCPSADQAQHASIKGSIELSLERVITLSNTERDQHSDSLFMQRLPKELQNLLQLEALRLDCPQIAQLPNSTLLAKLNDFTKIYNQRMLEKAKNNIATLAFREYRWINGFWDKGYVKSMIKDVKNMIIDCLKLEGATYTQVLREKISGNIAENIVINKKAVQKAIQKALNS